MAVKAVGLVVLFALAWAILGAAQQAGPESPGLQLVAREADPSEWEFYLGTWLHQDEYGATHIFTFFRMGIYGVHVKWEKSDLLLGTVLVGDEYEAIFFDSDDSKDRHVIIHWIEPISAYGVFANELQMDADGNDQILLTVYRYVHQPQVESSRENSRFVMLLTRQVDDP